MAFMNRLNLKIKGDNGPSSPYAKLLTKFFNVATGLMKFYLAIELIIFIIFLIDVIFEDTNQVIIERRGLFFSLAIVMGLIHSIFNNLIDRKIIQLPEEFKLSRLMLVIPTILAMLNFITLRGNLITDFTFSLIFGLIIMALHKVIVLYFDVDTVVSYIFLFLAIMIFFSDSFYINNFETPLWDLLKRPLTLRNILTFSLPLALTAMGAAFNERAGVINIGLEGLLVMSAFGAVYFAIRFDNPWMGLLGAIMMGGLLGLVHAFLTITMKSEQIVTGVAINLFAAGATALLTALIWTPGKSDSLNEVQIFEKVNYFNMNFHLNLGFFEHTFDMSRFLKAIRFSNIDRLIGTNGIKDWSIMGHRVDKWPVIGHIFKIMVNFFSEFPDPLLVFNNQTPAIFLGILLLPLGHILLFKTKIGLRIRAIGESPQAAATAGINVHKYQYFAVILSGMLTGFAGGIIAFELKLFFAEMTLGQGFYSLAIMIFGKWTVIGAVGAALFFGFFRTMSIKISVAPDLAPNTPPPIVNVIPNIIALLALAGFVGRARPPASIGIPYDPNEGE